MTCSFDYYDASDATASHDICGELPKFRTPFRFTVIDFLIISLYGALMSTMHFNFNLCCYAIPCIFGRPRQKRENLRGVVPMPLPTSMRNPAQPQLVVGPPGGDAAVAVAPVGDGVEAPSQVQAPAALLAKGGDGRDDDRDDGRNHHPPQLEGFLSSGSVNTSGGKLGIVWIKILPGMKFSVSRSGESKSKNGSSKGEQKGVR